MTSISACVSFSWSPGIGDPELMGWVTVAVYLAAAIAAAAVVARGTFPDRSGRRERLFWCVAAAFLLLLAVNKQLDLQSALTAAARCLAQTQGWYGKRRAVQVIVILCLALGGTLGIVGLAWLLRGSLGRTGLALLGLGFVTLFVLIRAAGFHHMDLFINSRIAGLRLNWVLELPGPTLVLVAAMRGFAPRP
jgi:hypothetical protein